MPDPMTKRDHHQDQIVKKMKNPIETKKADSEDKGKDLTTLRKTNELQLLKAFLSNDAPINTSMDMLYPDPLFGGNFLNPFPIAGSITQAKGETGITGKENPENAFSENPYTKALGEAYVKYQSKSFGLQTQKLSKMAIRRMARRGGVKRISKTVYPEIRVMFQDFMKAVLKDTLIYLEHGRRHTVKPIDVINALKRQGRAIYGCGNPMSHAVHNDKSAGDAVYRRN